MQALQTTTDIAFKNILFLTDFSEASESALAYALGFANHFGAQIYPAHACDPLILSEGTTANVVDQIIENSRLQLEKLAKDKNMKGPILFGQGPVEILFPRWIEKNGIDLVVVGTHGRRGVQRLLMGSTAEFVFRNANCPVLTVGPHVAVRPYNGFFAENILFPTDLGPHAEFACSYALSFVHESRGRLTLMHVVPLDTPVERDPRQMTAAATRKLLSLVPPDSQHWCSPEVVLEVGDPAREVQKYAEKERPDLIVLGLPKNKEFSAHFRTGVTYKLVSSAPCPVLTIRDMTTH
jgi:nucleotide-binding universal stress UspA family protein